MRVETRKPVCSAPALQISKRFPARILAPDADIVKKNLEEILAADIVCVLFTRFPEVDAVRFGLKIAEKAQLIRLAS